METRDKAQICVGYRVGHLTVEAASKERRDGYRVWKCRCDCGGEILLDTRCLQRGTVTDCGCIRGAQRRRRDLTGQRFGRLTVLERSDKYAPRGQRKVRLWKCLCDCGAITYKATDTLTNPATSMCKTCAGLYAMERAREKAGFVDGTQISRIKNPSSASENRSGVRGVYYDTKTQRYRARLKFQGKTYNLGTFTSLDEAVKARKQGEEMYFGTYLAERGQQMEDAIVKVMTKCEMTREQAEEAAVEYWK